MRVFREGLAMILAMYVLVLFRHCHRTSPSLDVETVSAADLRPAGASATRAAYLLAERLAQPESLLSTVFHGFSAIRPGRSDTWYLTKATFTLVYHEDADASHHASLKHPSGDAARVVLRGGRVLVVPPRVLLSAPGCAVVELYDPVFYAVTLGGRV